MSFKYILTLQFIVLLFTLPSLLADDEPCKLENLSKTSISHKGATLNVELERLDPKSFKEVDKDGKIEVWIGDRQLPRGIELYSPTLIKSFSVTINGKAIEVPKKYWNDIAGVELTKLVELRAAKDSDEELILKKSKHFQATYQPTINLSGGRDTAIVKWARIESCADDTVFTWIIHSNGTVLKHTKLPEEGEE